MTSPLWDDGWEELGRADGVLGEVLLRRRPTPRGPLVELVCAGVQVMDDHDTSTETALATLALAELPEGGAGLRVVVGGLGLGFTAAAALADRRVEHVLVVEVEPAVVEWVGAGLVPATAHLLAEPRVEVRTGDVTEVLPALPSASADAVLLDVDNGPGFLVAPANAELYRPQTLRSVAEVLRPGGVLAVWSADTGQAAVRLTEDLEAAVGAVRVARLVVRREERDLEYRVHVATRRLGPSAHG